MRAAPVSLNVGHRVGTLKAVEVVGSQRDAAGGSPSSLGKLVPGHLSLVQQYQLMQLMEAYRDVFSQNEDDIGQIPVLEHTIEIEGPPVRSLTVSRT